METSDHVGKKPDKVRRVDDDDESSPSSSSSSSSSSSRSSLMRESDTNENGDRSNAKPPEPSSTQPEPVSPAVNPSPPMKSPPVQTMGQPPGYDPNRIPASIFSSKPTNPGEWSVNSNESLFSIHMGNNSFSHDYSVLFGKSGEFPRLDDLSTAQHSGLLPLVMEVPDAHEENCSGELSRTPRKDEKKSSDAALHVKTDQASDNHHHVITKKPEAFADPQPAHDVPEVKKAPQQAENNVNRSSSSNLTTIASPPRFSDESGNSGSSFAFPVLVSDGAKTSSLKSVPENPRCDQGGPQTPAAADPNKEHNTAAHKLIDTRWYSSCFSCWPRSSCKGSCL